MLALTFAAAIVAQSPLVRSGLAAILGGSPNLRVVAEATPGKRRCSRPRAWTSSCATFQTAQKLTPSSIRLLVVSLCWPWSARAPTR